MTCKLEAVAVMFPLEIATIATVVVDVSYVHCILWEHTHQIRQVSIVVSRQRTSLMHRKSTYVGFTVSLYHSLSLHSSLSLYLYRLFSLATFSWFTHAK